MSKAAKRNTITALNCPALALALQIDRASSVIERLQEASFVLLKKPDREESDRVRIRVEQAEDDWQRQRDSTLHGLALSQATSIEGALAKAFIAFGILEGEVETPHEDASKQSQFLFLARALMGDFRRAAEKLFDVQVSEIGTQHWYTPKYEPQVRMAESATLVDISS